jgi:Tol biopolymer transport system component
MAGRPGRRARQHAAAAAVLAVGVVLLAGSFAPITTAGVPADAPASPDGARPETMIRPSKPAGPSAPAAPAAVSLEIPGTNQRVSLGPKGEQLPATVGLDPAISADGRWVAYRAIAVVDGRSAYAVRLHDRREGSTIQLYPVRGTASDGFALNPGLGILGPPAISGDGRFVAFAEAIKGGWQIRMWGADQGLFAPFAGTQAARVAFSMLPSLSTDGRHLAFLGGISGATTARVPPSYFLLDRETGVVTPVGLDQAGRQVGSTSSQFFGDIVVSGDGTRVAFSDQSPESKLTRQQVWLRDVATARTTLLSARPDGSEGAGNSTAPSITVDGRLVAFESTSSDLVADDRNGRSDVLVWRDGAGLRRASLAPDGAEAGGASGQPALSGNGRYLAFASAADNLVPGDTTGPLPPGTDAANPTDIFALDLVNGYLARVSVGIGPSEPDGSSSGPSLSGNGRFVAFTSGASNLVADDTNAIDDVFVRQRIAELTVAPNPTDFGSAPVQAPPGVTRTLTIASTGGFVARVEGLEPAGTDAGDFLASADTCTGKALYPGDACTVEVLFLPLEAGSRTAQLRVDATTPTPPVPATLLGSGGAGRITVVPALGPPGIVTVVTGTGFPPGAPITLSWSAGITPQPLAPIVTDAKGGFVAQLLVLPRDRIGTRQVRATLVGTAAPVAPATARFLVVKGTVAPPISGLVQVFADEMGRPIILRR